MDPEALRWRKIPWHNIPQLSRAGVLPFLSIKDNVEFDIALLNDEECRDDYLLSHKNKKGLPAYDNWVYTNTDNFQGLRWVMKRGIKLNTLQMRVGEDGETDRDRVLWWLVYKQHGDIAREYVRLNSDVRDVEAGGSFSRRMTLGLASAHGYVEVVNALIATGADVNKAINDGCTPIYEASSYGHLEVVQALIAAGADVNKAGNYGYTPISQASSYGHLKVVQALIAAGADVNKADNDGSTPISFAYFRLSIAYSSLSIASCNVHEKVVYALLAAGAI
jgi:ankyrin repeat protein